MLLHRSLLNCLENFNFKRLDKLKLKNKFCAQFCVSMLVKAIGRGVQPCFLQVDFTLQSFY